jgi:hypothetical protein
MYEQEPYSKGETEQGAVTVPNTSRTFAPGSGPPSAGSTVNVWGPDHGSDQPVGEAPAQQAGTGTTDQLTQHQRLQRTVHHEIPVPAAR